MKSIKHCFIGMLVPLWVLACWAGEAPSPTEYSTNVHVVSSQMVLEGNSVTHHQHLRAVIGGKKYELESIEASNALLTLGDYKAALVKDDHKRAYDSWQVYEILFPDNRTRRFLVVGHEE